MRTAILTKPRTGFINWVQEAVLPTHNSLERPGGLRGRWRLGRAIIFQLHMAHLKLTWSCSAFEWG